MENPTIDFHGLADAAGLQAVREEFFRRARNGLTTVFNTQSVYDKAYADAIHAYTAANVAQVGGTEEAPT